MLISLMCFDNGGCGREYVWGRGECSLVRSVCHLFKSFLECRTSNRWLGERGVRVWSGGVGEVRSRLGPGSEIEGNFQNVSQGFPTVGLPALSGDLLNASLQEPIEVPQERYVVWYFRKRPLA